MKMNDIYKCKIFVDNVKGIFVDWLDLLFGFVILKNKKMKMCIN